MNWMPLGAWLSALGREVEEAAPRRAARLDRLARQTPVLAIVNIVNAGLVALILLTSFNGRIAFQLLVVGWMLLIWVAALLRLRRWHRRGARPSTGSPRGIRTAIRHAVMAGLMWGLGIGAALVEVQGTERLLLIVILAGMSAGAATNLSPLPTAAYGFILACLLPSIVALIAVDALQQVALAGMILAYMVAILYATAGLHAAFLEDLERGLENQRLMEELAAKARELEQARAAAEQSEREKTRIVAAASHDLRQPLQGMELFTTLLQSEIGEGRGREALTGLQLSLNSLRDQFDRLLDMARLEAGVVEVDPQRITVGPLFERIEADFRLAAEQKGLRFKVRPSPVPIITDPLLLERVVRNLVSNAVRYTDDGGVLLGCHARGNRLRIAVYDTGPGIEEGELSHIFEEFARGSARVSESLGLGLSVARSAAQMIGAELGVRSREGRGSRFWVDVRRAAE